MRIEIGPNEQGQRLDKFLRKYLKDVPLSAIFKALRKGDVRVNGSKGKEKQFLQEGDVVEIKYLYSNSPKEKKEVFDIEPEFKVTFEDDNILMVEKWPGILVHKDKEGKDPTLTDQVLSYLFRKGAYDPKVEKTFSPSPVNRLDRNTSGIVIYAKNYEALKTLNEMMRDGRIIKNYIAIVKGRIADGEYRAYIEKREDNNVSSVSDTPGPMKKEIAMTVKTMESTGQYSLVELNLLTGRSHQLRAHLASLGNPIIGDKKYGVKEINSFLANKYDLNFQYLYAYKVTIKNPDGALAYLGNKVVAEKLPPIFKKVKNDLFKFDL
jgi:23S rRNA pseudouridine955/2504/2580 synthase